jgi:hypothetical protein
VSPTRRLVTLGGTVAALLAAAPLRAQTYGSIVRERYVACREEAELRAAPPPLPSAAPALELTPVSRRAAPGVLSIAPLLVIDVAVEQPVPSRRATPAAPLAEAPPEAVAIIEGENDYHCLGVPRGKARILRVVAAGPGARFGGGRDPHGYRRDNLIAAGTFDLRESIPALRRELDRPLSPALEPHAVFDRLDEKLAAMRSLADLGDASSAGRVVAYLRGREARTWSGFWPEALETLARLDATAAQDYAVEVLQGVPQRPAEADFLVRAVLPFLRRPSPAALAALQRLEASTDGHPARWHDACDILAARVRVGDDALKRALRPELAGDLTTNRSAVCYGQVIDVVFPGDDPDEVDTLLKRHRYDEILHLLDRARALRARGPLDARWTSAEKKLLAWLQQHRQDTGADPVNGVDVASPKITNGVPETNAKHLAALAVLGDAAARRDLFRLVDDPGNPGTGPWIAAVLALRFDLEGAADHAANRLRLGVEQSTQRFSRDAWPRRGQVVVTEHGELVDALAARQDPRFTLGLLDRDAFTRDLAMNALARLRPERACELVSGAASRAEEPAIQQAFWALSVLGEACQGAMERLLDDRAQPPEVKGMALEALAMMRDRRVKGLLEPQGRGDKMSAARARARLIYRSQP